MVKLIFYTVLAFLGPTFAMAQNSCPGLFLAEEVGVPSLRNYVRPHILIFNQFLARRNYGVRYYEPVYKFVINENGEEFAVPARRRLTLGAQQYEAAALTPASMSAFQHDFEILEKGETELFEKSRRVFEQTIVNVLGPPKANVPLDPVQTYSIEFDPMPAFENASRDYPERTQRRPFHVRMPHSSRMWQERLANEPIFDIPFFSALNEQLNELVRAKLTEFTDITEEDVPSIQTLRERNKDKKTPTFALEMEDRVREMKNDSFLKESLSQIGKQEIPSFLRSFLSIVKDDERGVIVKIDMDYARAYPNARQREFIELAHFINWVISQRIYRESGLIPNNLESALALANNAQSGGHYDLYWGFSQRIWNSFLYRLNHTVSGAFMPLFPQYGMSVYRSKNTLSRLFMNSYVDPLEILPKEKPRPGDNYRFYLSILETLPDDMMIQSEALSLEHYKLYHDRFGFEVYDRLDEFSWGRMLLLRQRNGVVVERLRELLDRNRNAP